MIRRRMCQDLTPKVGPSGKAEFLCVTFDTMITNWQYTHMVIIPCSLGDAAIQSLVGAIIILGSNLNDQPH